MPIDPLEVETLPSDPREMALRLLGMTVSELKEIDQRVISGHNHVGGVKVDVNKIYNEVVSMPVGQNKQETPQAIAQPPQQIPVQTNNYVPQPAPIPVAVPPIHQVTEDSNQLELDFYRKVRPEDIEYQLKRINDSISDINIKLEKITDILTTKKNYRKLNGNCDQ
jgi:hypothetical protein